MFEDGPDCDKVQHVLRVNADPLAVYKDGRVGKIMENISEIAMNIKSYEKEKWDGLVEHTHQIFTYDYKAYMTELKKN